MIDRLLLFGATGDLVGRYLLPALAELLAAGRLPEQFKVVATAREELSDEGFRRMMAERLADHAPEVPPAVRAALVGRLRYRSADVVAADFPDRLRSVLVPVSSDDIEDAGMGRPVAAYLALPPALFEASVRALASAGLPTGSRIAVEKPFGEDLHSAIEFNQLLARIAGPTGEDAIYRIDHILGLVAVQNLLGLRLANRIIEAVWNSTHIEEIEIVWEETLGLEGRAGYFDQTGALKDVMQNHMLQILALIAMEPPADAGTRALQDRKMEALLTVRPPAADRMVECTRRARYTAGRLRGTDGADLGAVPDYALEKGVDPSRGTETFAEVVLELDSERWSGTRFVLRTGKALHRDFQGIVVRFRPASHLALAPGATAVVPNEMYIGLGRPEGVTLRLTGSIPGPPTEHAPVNLHGSLPAPGLGAYSQVLLDILTGESNLSIRAEEAEEAWRIVTPVIRAWERGEVPLDTYPAGSAGPPRRAR